jgi:hypothetical protein
VAAPSETHFTLMPQKETSCTIHWRTAAMSSRHVALGLIEIAHSTTYTGSDAIKSERTLAALRDARVDDLDLIVLAAHAVRAAHLLGLLDDLHEVALIENARRDRLTNECLHRRETRHDPEGAADGRFPALLWRAAAAYPPLPTRSATRWHRPLTF